MHEVARAPIDIGRVLKGRYRLEERLGSGRVGVVFRATDLRAADEPAHRHVAVKLVDRAHDGGAHLDERLAGLRHEFERLRQLSHPGIVKMFELDRDGDIDFFTMEYLDGARLSGVMNALQPGSMLRSHAWPILRAVGAALGHAHAHGVVHANLKPHSVWITQSGEVRLGDFGWSGAGAPAAANSAYRSCELLAGRSPDPSDDIYSFACLAYELLSGEHPFQRRPSTEARNFAIVPRRIPDLSRRQWRMLTMGLCWHRAGRSIPVLVWAGRLVPRRAAQLPVAPARELAPRPSAAPTGGLRVGLAATLAVLVSAFVGIVVVRSGVPLPAVPADAIAMHPQPWVVPAPTAPEPADVLAHEAGGGRIPAVAPGRAALFSSDYQILPGEHYAEIRIHLRAGRSRDRALTWWTEAASAKPGIDYVTQEKVTQALPAGRSTASFFVKLVPRTMRTRREVFYVDIAEGPAGSVPGHIARAAVWLPTNRNLASGG